MIINQYRIILIFCIFFTINCISDHKTSSELRDSNGAIILTWKGSGLPNKATYWFRNGEKKTVIWDRVKRPVDSWEDAGIVLGGLQFSGPNNTTIFQYLNEIISNRFSRYNDEHNLNTKVMLIILFDKDGQIMDARICGKSLSYYEQAVIIESILDTNGMWSPINSKGKRDQMIMIHMLIY